LTCLHTAAIRAARPRPKCSRRVKNRRSPPPPDNAADAADVIDAPIDDADTTAVTVSTMEVSATNTPPSNASHDVYDAIAAAAAADVADGIDDDVDVVDAPCDPPLPLPPPLLPLDDGVGTSEPLITLMNRSISDGRPPAALKKRSNGDGDELRVTPPPVAAPLPAAGVVAPTLPLDELPPADEAGTAPLPPPLDESGECAINDASDDGVALDGRWTGKDGNDGNDGNDANEGNDNDEAVDDATVVDALPLPPPPPLPTPSNVRFLASSAPLAPPPTTSQRMRPIRFYYIP
jgi:hypothetical protein